MSWHFVRRGGWFALDPARQFIRDAVAENVRALRARSRLKQGDVAERMRRFGFGKWSRATVSEVERGNRGVLADELVALAVVFEASIDECLAPRARLDADDKLVLMVGNVMRGLVSHPAGWADGEPLGYAVRVASAPRADG
jgi:transcriptional regulator with XRE-family HTH domain